ncbi:MAG: hypothetical protein CTR54_09015 [Rhizobium sp.]|nr:MAG: hypothetical protein CTR54_09015 [Rhizobium sp.]
MGIIPRNVSEDKQARPFGSQPIEPPDFRVAERQIVQKKIGECVLGYQALVTSVRKSRWSHFRGRMREIEKLIKDRHGQVVPETDDAFIYLECICNLLFVEYNDQFIDKARQWGRRWYPWATLQQLEEVAYERTKVSFTPLTADALGHALHLTYEERQRLGIRTIGACDVSKRQRQQIQNRLRRLRDCERKREKRRQAGKKTRDEYLATSVSATKPWQEYGICRRTWEKRGKPNPQAISGHVPN